MKISKLLQTDNDIEFYLSIQDGKTNYIVYTSQPYLLTELDILSLIKICLVRRRNKIIGNKLLQVYKDATYNRQGLTNQRLKAIGIIQNEMPTRTKQRNPKVK